MFLHQFQDERLRASMSMGNIPIVLCGHSSPSSMGDGTCKRSLALFVLSVLVQYSTVVVRFLHLKSIGKPALLTPPSTSSICTNPDQDLPLHKPLIRVGCIKFWSSPESRDCNCISSCNDTTIPGSISPHLKSGCACVRDCWDLTMLRHGIPLLF
jgi:hypothetical protein